MHYLHAHNKLAEYIQRPVLLNVSINGLDEVIETFFRSAGVTSDCIVEDVRKSCALFAHIYNIDSNLVLISLIKRYLMAHCVRIDLVIHGVTGIQALGHAVKR